METPAAGLEWVESMQKQNSETTLEILSLLDKDEEDNIVDEIDENLEVAKKETISAVDRIGKTMAMCKTYEYILQCVPMAIGLGMVVFYTWKHCNKVGNQLQNTNSGMLRFLVVAFGFFLTNPVRQII